jgi:hypothetical protein
MSEGGNTQRARSCGSCSCCCTVLRVDPLRKLGGVDCVHQAARGCSTGCTIHGRPERPALCGAYRCAWLQGAFEDADRPDRLGAVLDFSTEGPTPMLGIRETEAGNFDRSARLQEIARETSRTMPVRVSSADDVMNADRLYRVLMPGGEEHWVEGEFIERRIGNRSLGRQRMPLLERTLRRASLWWRRRRLRGYRSSGSPE